MFADFDAEIVADLWRAQEKEDEMAKDATSPTGLIIVPKPGELLHALGATGALAQAAPESVATYTWPKLKDTAFFNDLYLSGHPEFKAGPEVGIDWAEEGGFSVSMPIMVNKPNMIKSPTYVNPLYEPIMKDDEKPEGLLDEATISAKAEVMKKLALMSGQYGGSWTGFMPLLDTENKKTSTTDPDWDGHTYVDTYDDKLDQEVEEEVGVDIVFWYYRDTDLIYSIRRVTDNFFYDFSNKRFSLVPIVYRAGMPSAEPIKPSGYVYSTKLSGKLNNSEYVITFRDTKANDVVVGVMALFMKDGKLQPAPQVGLEDTPIEEGLPSPSSTFRRADQRVRSVDV
jgi:hypothetical protein